MRAVLWDVSGVGQWAVELMERMGGLGLAVAIALENMFPPLPSEMILPLAGFTAGQGRLGLAEVVVWATVGSVVGAWALYGLGRAFGLDRVRGVVRRLPLVKVEDVDRTVAWFDRHGEKAVLLGRMIPIFRSLISVPAGACGMSLVRFTALTLLGSAVWNAVFIVAGYLLGSRWAEVEQYGEAFQKLVIVGVLALVALFVVRRVRENAARRER